MESVIKKTEKRSKDTSTTGTQTSERAPKEKLNLESMAWYHGMRARKECEALLKNEGEWLVRASDTTGSVEIILSVVTAKGQIAHMMLNKDDNRWSLAALRKPKPERFASVVELIHHYQKRGISKIVALKTPVSRPVWLLKHTQITFDEKKDKLGAGNFCAVYKGVYKELSGQTHCVAVKVIKSSEQEQTPEQITKQRIDMLREAELLSFLSHEHVIRLFGVACDHPPIQIIIEYCPGGDLESHLKKHHSEIEVAECILYLIDISKGMGYLHEKKTLHRDLATRNCLISKAGLLKIADFGLSKMIVGEQDVDAEGLKGGMPLRWMAPESLVKDPKYSSKTDVWSFGVVIYEIFVGNRPWPDWEFKKVATHIRKGKMMELPEKVPADLKKVVTTQIWNMDPSKRPEFKELLKILLRMSKAIGEPKHPIIKREEIACVISCTTLQSPNLPNGRNFSPVLLICPD